MSKEHLIAAVINFCTDDYPFLQHTILHKPFVNLARLVGFYFVDKPWDYILFLDCDEIIGQSPLPKGRVLKGN